MKISNIAGYTLMCGTIGLSLVLAGCSSTSRVAQNSKGSVSLEEVTDWSFEASHPAVIDQATIMKVVKGIYGEDTQSGSTRMSAGGSKPMRVFSDEDAEFLAPLLAQGLSKAKPEQLVGFRVSPSAGSGSEPTAGSIYVQQGAIYFTVSKGAGATIFMPESVARTEQAPPYARGGMAGVSTHVIDYHALARTAMPAPMPIAKAVPKPQAAPVLVAAPSSKAPASSVASVGSTGDSEASPELAAQLSHAKETIAKKDSEINMLRKESDWMKRELRERDEEIKALRTSKVSSKAAPKKKQAELYPAR